MQAQYFIDQIMLVLQLVSVEMSPKLLSYSFQLLLLVSVAAEGQKKCELTGFQTRTREECEEVTEINCKPITVKKIRTEIRHKCETMMNKTCQVIYNSEPKQQCKPKTSLR